MAQPDYVPLTPADRVRPIDRLPPARRWFPERPAEVTGPGHPSGRRMGVQGPDQGYGAKLAERFRGKLRIEPDEDEDDAIAGCLAVALRRAALFGRAPVIHDLEMAFTLWGFLGDSPSDLIEYRKSLFQAASHDYWAQRPIADAVSESTLRLTPARVREQMSDWRSLFTSPPS